MEQQKTAGQEFRHSSGLPGVPQKRRKARVPKTARLKIINGRPYYYAIENIWLKDKQVCRQKNTYLGKTLPKGYRLVK